MVMGMSMMYCPPLAPPRFNEKVPDDALAPKLGRLPPSRGGVEARDGDLDEDGVCGN